MLKSFLGRAAPGRRSTLAVVAAGALVAAGAGALDAVAKGERHHAARTAATFTNALLLSGSTLSHATAGGTEALSGPDDITYLDGHIFVAFQNGVGAQGEPSLTGNLDSTIVELDRSGRALKQWDIVGKCDGLTADPQTHNLVATVNEDANSSIYLLDPAAGTAVHYSYAEPLPHLGGTDAITIHDGSVLISASAPGTSGGPAAPQPYPAVYRVEFHAATHTATVHEVFGDESTATVANRSVPNSGQSVALALTDPDSSSSVPTNAHRFAGDFMLDSQGDDEQIFAAGAHENALFVLKLSVSIDDTVWASEPTGAIVAVDHAGNAIDKISGPFEAGAAYVAATPCNDNSAPSTCPAAGFPANFLGQENLDTGAITPVPVSGPDVHPQSLLFVP